MYDRIIIFILTYALYNMYSTRRLISADKEMIWDLISISAGGMYAVPFILYFMTYDHHQLLGFIGLVATLGIGEFIKHYIIKTASPRPKGAADCNLWCNDGNQEDRPGMPSGHSSQVVFFASFYYSQTKSPWIRSLLVMYALAVMYARYAKHCHTIPQIATGALLGFIISKCVYHRA